MVSFDDANKPEFIGMRPKCNCVKMYKKLLANENLAANLG